MPPSAAVWARDLAALVADICNLDSSSLANGIVEARVNELGNRLSCVVISALDAETVAALDRAVQAAAKQLSALGTRLAVVVRRGNASAEHVSDRLYVASSLSLYLLLFASEHTLRGGVQALHSCITLPLECGRALMASADASCEESTGPAYKCLDMQARFLLNAVAGAIRAGCAERCTAQLAPPERLLPWLSAAVSKVLAVTGTSLGRGVDASFPLQNVLLQIIYQIVNNEYFAPHAAAVQLDGGLQRSLVRLLVTMLHASAAAMQLPAERRPADFHIKFVAQIVFALISPLLGTSFLELVSPTSQEHSIYAERVLQSTAQLFAAMPASCPPDVPRELVPFLWSHLLMLLGNAGILVNDSIAGQREQGNTAFSDAQCRGMLQQLQLALSRLPTALSVAAGPSRRHALAAFGFITGLWGLLISQELEANVHGSLAEVTAYCATGSALLQSLPQVAAPAQLATGRQQQSQDEMTDSACVAARLTANLVCQVCMSIAVSGPINAADSAAAGDALWQLHTALCRCIHYLSTAPAGIRFDELLPSLGHCIEAAQMVCSRVCAAPLCSPASHSVAKPRHLLAMSVAQFEVALAVAGACHLPPEDERAAVLLLEALDHGPAALASNPSVRQVLDRVLDRNAAGEAPHSTRLPPALLAGLQQHQQQRREPQPGDALELAKAAATRSCAYLHCANLAGEGGPAAGQGAGSQRCSKCKVAWYCGTACSHADWRAGHRRVCRALGAMRVSKREGERGEV